MNEETKYVRASAVNVLGNALKLVIEGALGLAFGSLALIADAAASLGDVIASTAVLLGGRLRFADPDTGHPHGHERIEPFSALIVSVILLIVAGGLLYEVTLAIIDGPEGQYSDLLLTAVGIAIVLRLVGYWYTDRINRELDAPGLRALTKDAKSDVYASLAVALGLLGFAAGYPLLDPLAGGLVSLLIFREGVDIARENVPYLVGGAPPSDKREHIETLLLAHPAVHDFHDFRIHYVGPEFEVEVHAEIDTDHSFVEAHDIEMELRESIEDLQKVRHAHIHLDPFQGESD